MGVSQTERDRLLREYDAKVDAKLSQLESHLQFQLAEFKDRQARLLSLIPAEVRTMTMREFGAKYSGDIVKATVGARAALKFKDPAKLAGKRHRKTDEKIEEIRSLKSARLYSPAKVSLSPRKRLLSNSPRGTPRSRLPVSILRSPSKLNPAYRPPTTPKFSPAIPIELKTFARRAGGGLFASSRNQHLQSVGNSPSVDLSLRLLSPRKLNVPSPSPSPSIKRARSAIIIRHVSVSTSRAPLDIPSRAPTDSSGTPGSRIKMTPRRGLSRARSMISLQVASDKNVELDPVLNSPGDIDALQGITDSAKRDVKAEMRRLISAAADKWTIS
ncbi:hypothetical protein FISHEDRAFT_75566 [Fistulina hepatica ATCC 64428]|uniref:Borealin N-terminal domain-containing protein n=1 Tax=Fistulina hepatica ATCC 64428 TaxID=1128425 RepID=A0A0D7A733_9AGAR|nr:hypothetical protein FISHEDRAFT_75566 [Fistulina hepatica ATCC 64428]